MTSWHEVINRNGSKTGILKKCASDPCYLHNGSDFSIASDNPAHIIISIHRLRFTPV